MNIEIKIHYWPNTPHLREVKFLLDGEEIRSSFMGKDELWKLREGFRIFKGQIDTAISELE
jgi:hypothetical protein